MNSRRGAMFEARAMFKRRSATRVLFVPDPWSEDHGYHHQSVRDHRNPSAVTKFFSVAPPPVPPIARPATPAAAQKLFARTASSLSPPCPRATPTPAPPD